MIKFQDESGRMISQIIEVPVGSTIGDAVEPGELEEHIARNDSVVVDLHKAAATARDKARNAEETRLQRLKRKRGHDGGQRDSTSGDSSPEVGRGGSMSPPHFLDGGLGPSRLAQIRKRFKASKKKQASGEFAGDASDDGEEDDHVYTTYTGVLDDADYNREEEIGDYKTGYSLAGGVEALAEEEEEIILREENQRYMEQAYNQLIAGRDPSKPIDWYGDPSVGAPVKGKGGAGDDDQSGALRVHDGVTLRIVTMPPVFKAPRAPGFAPGQCYLGAKGKVSHGFKGKPGPGSFGRALAKAANNFKKPRLPKKGGKSAAAGSGGSRKRPRGGGGGGSSSASGSGGGVAAAKGGLGLGVGRAAGGGSGGGSKRSCGAAAAAAAAAGAGAAATASAGHKERRKAKARGKGKGKDKSKAKAGASAAEAAARSFVGGAGAGGGGGGGGGPAKPVKAEKLTRAQIRRAILMRAPSAETFGRTARGDELHDIAPAPSPAPSGGDRLDAESIDGMDGVEDDGGGGGGAE